MVLNATRQARAAAASLQRAQLDPLGRLRHRPPVLRLQTTGTESVPEASIASIAARVEWIEVGPNVSLRVGKKVRCCNALVLMSQLNPRLSALRRRVSRSGGERIKVGGCGSKPLPYCTDEDKRINKSFCRILQPVANTPCARLAT